MLFKGVAHRDMKYTPKRYIACQVEVEHTVEYSRSITRREYTVYTSRAGQMEEGSGHVSMTAAPWARLESGCIPVMQLEYVLYLYSKANSWLVINFCWYWVGRDVAFNFYIS